MSKHRETFLLQDEKQRERLQALAQSPDDSLQDERLLCKLAAEQAINAGAYGLAATICGISARIRTAEVANRIKTGDLISREQVVALIRTIVDAVADEIEGKYPGWEDSLSRIADRLDSTTKNKTLQLEDQR